MRKVTAYALFLLVCATLVMPSMAVTLTPGSTSITNIANGDPVVISGIATGHPQNGLQVWVIGKELRENFRMSRSTRTTHIPMN